MKSWTRLSAVLVIGALLLCGVASAETSIAEPEYVGNILAIQGENGLALEKQRASSHARAGFMKTKSSNIVKKGKSPVRLTAGSDAQFIVRAATNDVDPAQVVNLFALVSDPNKDYRYVETGSQGPFTGDAMVIDFLPFTSKRYGESSYLLTISVPLAPGEYAMTLDDSRDVFNLFGVD
jgi:hypothetical protein